MRSIKVVVPKKLHCRCLDSTWHQHRQSSVSLQQIPPVRNVEVVVNRHKRYRGARPLYRTDIFYSWNVLLLNYYYKQDTQLDYHMAVTRAISHQDLMQEDSWKSVCKEGFTRAFLTMFELTVLKSFSYLILLFILGLLFASILIPFIFIEDRAVGLGFHQKDAYAMLFFAGFGSLFGILLSAVFAVFSFNNDYEGLLMLILVSGGVFCVLSNYIVAIHYQMIFALMIGTIMGQVRAISPVVIYNLVGLEDLTNFFGYGLIAEGLGTIGGPLLAGYYVEASKSARQAFICAGIFMVVAGILLPFVKYLKSHSRDSMSIII